MDSQKNTSTKHKKSILRRFLNRRLIGSLVLLLLVGILVFDALSPTRQVKAWFPIFLFVVSYICFYPDIRAYLPPQRTLGILSILLSIGLGIRSFFLLLPTFPIPYLFAAVAPLYFYIPAMPLLFGLVCLSPNSRSRLLWCWGVCFAVCTYYYFSEPFPLEPWDGLLRLNFYYANYGGASYYLNLLVIFPILATLVSFGRADQLNPQLLSRRILVLPMGCIALLIVDLALSFLFDAFCDSGPVILAFLYLLDWVQLALFVFLLVLCVEWIVSKCQRPEYKFPIPE